MRQYQEIIDILSEVAKNPEKQTRELRNAPVKKRWVVFRNMFPLNWFMRQECFPWVSGEVR